MHLATLSGGAMAFIADIRDLEVLDLDGTWVLQSSSGAAGGITTFALHEAEIADLVSQEAYTTYTRSFVGAEHGEDLLSIPLVRLNNVLDQADSGPEGAAVSAQVFLKNSGFAGSEMKLLAVQLDAGTFVYAGLYGSPGIATYRMTGSTSMALESMTSDTSAAHLGDVSAMASCRIDDKPWLFSASAGENGITSFRIRPDGSLQISDNLGTGQGLFVAAPSAIETVHLGAEAFLVVAASGSSSLSVLRVDAEGKMQVVEHIVDSLDTRFANVTALEIVTVGDRVFVVAAGSDDGLTLFTLLPGGRLLQLSSLSDSDAMNLANVSALAAVRIGAEIQIFASSQLEPGISQFSIDLSNLGEVLDGRAVDDRLTGGALQDLLAGRSGDDVLFGGLGDDILMDGAGKDRMTGGVGADQFVLTYDGQADTINDFEAGVDRLDLSAWPMFYSAGQLSIVSTGQGARLRFGSEVIEVISADRSPLTLADFVTGAILNLQRPPGSLEGPGLSLKGTAAADVMIGAGGDDMMTGSAGEDWIMAGEGTDTMVFSSRSAGLVLDLKQPGKNTGEARGDDYDGVEIFRGTGQGDRMSGDVGDNSFYGSDGNDWLRGRGGDDDLGGGAGVDRIVGGKGADQLSGGLLGDRFVFLSRNETLPTAAGRDVISDFGLGPDLIDLTDFDANRLRGGRQDFKFINAADFSGKAGELRFTRDADKHCTVISGDLNGDGVADFEIELSGLFLLQRDDFLF